MSRSVFYVLSRMYQWMQALSAQRGRMLGCTLECDVPKVRRVHKLVCHSMIVNKMDATPNALCLVPTVRIRISSLQSNQAHYVH